MTLTTILLLLTALAAAPAPQAASIGTETIYLSGTGSDNTVDWDFYFSAGRGSGRWTTIPVPSCWECQGFGQYVYGTMPQEDRIKESGIYRHEFTVPAEWKGKSVDIVFEGVMTDTEVKINGKPAGPKHQGGYCEFRYDVSQLLRYGRTNSIEVNVDKASSNQSVEEAERECDFWTYGGIYRPVYLEAKPAAHIEDIAIDAKADTVLYQIPDLNCADIEIAGDSLYVYSTEFDYNTYQTIVAFSIYDIAQQKVVSRNFITDGTEGDIVYPYGMSVNPENGDIYITDAKDFVTPGMVYCYDRLGNRKWAAMTGDIPGHFAYVRHPLNLPE